MANRNNRPISPHLQIYKLPPTGIVSITHRITGVLLSAGLIFFACLVSAVADGAQSYAAMQHVMANPLLRFVYWCFIYALFFHLCHGVRHLLWDAGHGFDLETMNRYVLIELAASLSLTAAVFIFIN